jgi:hypothetical protein
MAYPTLLVITPVLNATGADTPMLPIYASRGITQTLTLIQGTGEGESALGNTIRRTINGLLLDLTAPQFRKYASDINFGDVEMPAMDGAWLGTVCQVDCTFELAFPVGGHPQREVVLGSERTEGHFVFYRPSLLMMLVGFNTSFDEWNVEFRSGMKFQEQ